MAFDPPNLPELRAAPEYRPAAIDATQALGNYLAYSGHAADKRQVVVEFFERAFRESLIRVLGWQARGGAVRRTRDHGHGHRR